MNLNDHQKDALAGAFRYEETHDPSEFSLGWSWSSVRVPPATLNNLILKGLIEEKFHSNSYRGLLLTDLGRQQAKLIVEPMEVYEKPQDKSLMVQEEMFEDIIGHDDIKELLTAVLFAEKPVHVLLAGPPALAKSLFLWDVERVCGEQAIWLVGSATSKAGLWDLVAEY